MRSREESLRILRAENKEISPGQKWVVDDFTPADAPGIARLYYAVYGENFPYDGIYDPDEIVLANVEELSHHIVGRTENGDIIGVYAFFRNPPGRHIMEGGSWIVLPSYRNTTLAYRMASRAHTVLPGKFNINMLFGQSVCDHVITHKLAEKMGSCPCAFEVEVMPPRPGIDDVSGQERISLLDLFIQFADSPHTVYLPPRYAEVLEGRYVALKASREFRDDPGSDEACVCSAEAMDAASLVRITVDKPGRDFPERLRLLDQEHQDKLVSQLFIPLYEPGVAAAVEAARGCGYFLGGLLPLWRDADVLLMQKIGTDPDFERIKLIGTEAPALLSAIIADWRSLERRL